MSTATITAPPLDEESLAMLLDEVVAMAAAQRSLVIGLADIEAAATGKLGRAAGFVQARIRQGQSPSQAIAELTNKYQAPIHAAMQVLSETGSTEPMRETVRLIRESKEHRYQIMLAAINPMLSVVVAAVVVFWVMPWILVSVSDAQTFASSRASLTHPFQETLAENFTAAALATVVLVGAFGGLLYATLTRSIGRGDTLRDHTTFCRWLAIQIESKDPPGGIQGVGIETGRAIATAAGVVGDSFAATWAVVTENVRAGAQTAPALAMPSTTPQPVQRCVADLAGGRRDRQSIARDLRRLSELYQQSSTLNRSWWVEVLPRLMTLVLMLGIIAVLIRVVLAPLVEVIRGMTG